MPSPRPGTGAKPAPCRKRKQERGPRRVHHTQGFAFLFGKEIRGRLAFSSEDRQQRSSSRGVVPRPKGFRGGEADFGHFVLEGLVERRGGALTLHFRQALHHGQTHVHILVLQHLLQLFKQWSLGRCQTQSDHCLLSRLRILGLQGMLQDFRALLVGRRPVGGGDSQHNQNHPEFVGCAHGVIMTDRVMDGRRATLIEAGRRIRNNLRYL